MFNKIASNTEQYIWLLKKKKDKVFGTKVLIERNKISKARNYIQFPTELKLANYKFLWSNNWMKTWKHSLHLNFFHFFFSLLFLTQLKSQDQVMKLSYLLLFQIVSIKDVLK